MVSYPSDFGGVPGSVLPSSLQQDLRPLTTGEVLDRTFQLYRARFRLFAGICSFAPAVSVVLAIIHQVLFRHQAVAAAHGAHKVHYGIAIYGFAVWIVSFVIYGVTQAAAVFAISQTYLGRDATIAGAYRAARKHWLRYTGIALAQLWTVGWPAMVVFAVFFAFAMAIRGTRPSGAAALETFSAMMLLLIASLFYALWMFIRVSLAMPAAVVEDLRIRASLKRSKALLTDRKIRIFLLLLLLFALYLVIGAVQGPLAVFSMRAHASTAVWLTGISLIVQFVTSTLIGPVGAIAFCLFYFDERVRREGFDIEWMMTGSAGPAEPAIPGPEQA